MKRIGITFFILIIAVPVFSQIRHNSFYLWEQDSSSATWQIKGTERDTSEWYLSNPTMTFYCFPRDTTTGANGDSVALTLYYQSSGNKDFGVTATDTFSIVTANDSVAKTWRKTCYPTDSGTFFRLIIAGEAGNDKDVGSLIDTQYDGYPAK